MTGAKVLLLNSEEEEGGGEVLYNETKIIVWAFLGSLGKRAREKKRERETDGDEGRERHSLGFCGT